MAEAGGRNLEATERTGDHIWSRRNILALSGWGAVATFFGVFSLAFVRFMYPRVLFEPPSSFKAGYPDEFMIGTVSEKYKDTKRVWIAREENGFYALLAICTHLGCTPRWLDTQSKFKCPCHGSGFTRDGVNFEGPAPRPLERVKVSFADDGQLLIDKSQTYRQELGQWGEDGSFLPYRETA